MPTISHVGICVSDLNASLRFYEHALGFQKAAALDVGNEVADLVGLGNDLRFTSQFLKSGTTLIELIAFSRPGTVTSEKTRPMNLVGLTHLSFRVDDLQETCERVRANGGRVVEETSIPWCGANGERGTIIFCLDPDDTRIELMAIPDSVRFD